MSYIITIVANTKAQAYSALNNTRPNGVRPNIIIGRPQKKFIYKSNVNTEFPPDCDCDTGKVEFIAQRQNGNRCYVLLAEFP